MSKEQIRLAREAGLDASLLYGDHQQMEQRWALASSLTGTAQEMYEQRLEAIDE